jgi:prephenate dehydratase
MHSYPEPALIQVKKLTDLAQADPQRAVAFQGAPGCNSHRAALEYAPDCAPLPCFSFEDALDAVKEGRAARAIIPSKIRSTAAWPTFIFCCPKAGFRLWASISCRFTTR